MVNGPWSFAYRLQIRNYFSRGVKTENRYAIRVGRPFREDNYMRKNLSLVCMLVFIGVSCSPSTPIVTPTVQPTLAPTAIVENPPPCPEAELVFQLLWASVIRRPGNGMARTGHKRM
jgi:hypothetical protein